MISNKDIEFLRKGVNKHYLGKSMLDKENEPSKIKKSPKKLDKASEF
jgi:hypothetical protein